MEATNAKWCSQCGTALSEGAGFCAACGAAVPTVETTAPAAVAEAAATSGSTKGRFSRRSKIIVGVSAVAVVAVAVASIFLLGGDKHPNPITKDNASTFLVASGDLSLGSNIDTFDEHFAGVLLTECAEDATATPLFAKGDTLAKVALTSETGADTAFFVHQRIYTADKADLTQSAELLKTVASDPTCDTSSDGAVFSYRFNYSDAQDMKTAYGLNLEGTRLKIQTDICSSGFVDCVSSSEYFVVAIHDNTAMMLTYSAEVPTVVSAVEAKLKAFAN